jgi:hypothetical protein
VPFERQSPQCRELRHCLLYITFTESTLAQRSQRPNRLMSLSLTHGN